MSVTSIITLINAPKKHGSCKDYNYCLIKYYSINACVVDVNIGINP